MKTVVRVLCLCLTLVIPAIAGRAAEAPVLPPETELVELPRPNSGTFTSEQAGARKHEILANVASKRLTGWLSPYAGFAIHIAADDTFNIYAMHQVSGGEEFPTSNVSISDILSLEKRTFRLSNPSGILITSDKPLGEAKAFPKLLDSLFVPGIQVYYLAKKPGA